MVNGGKVSKVRIYVPTIEGGVTEHNLFKCLTWPGQSKELTKRILEKFKEGAVSKFPYTHIPSESIADYFRLNPEVVFKIVTEKGSPRPSYSRFFEALTGYIDFLIKEYREKGQLEGVLTLSEGQPYISCGLFDEKRGTWTGGLLGKINSDLEILINEGIGLSQKLILVKPAELIDHVPSNLTLDFNKNYAEHTPENGITYEKARNLVKEGDSRIKKFKEEELLASSLEILGVDSEEEIQEVTGVSFLFDNFVFINQLEPRRNPQYKGMILALTKERPTQIKSNSKIGDLIKAIMIKQEGAYELLMSKGLIDDKFMVDYDPRLRENEVYVRLEGVRERLRLYRESLIEHTLEQNLSFLPKQYAVFE